MSAVPSPITTGAGQPAWEIARLFPAQGSWTEERFWDLPDDWRVELSNGCLEVLPMPTTSHQMILRFLFLALFRFVERRKLGTVLFSGIRVRLWPGEIREPDLVFMLARHAKRIREEFWEGADLVMEVVSGSAEDRRRDLVTKRLDYAKARIPEYWIVDPQKAEIVVLRLKGKKYAVHGRFGRKSRATSALLKGFEVEVEAALSAK